MRPHHVAYCDAQQCHGYPFVGTAAEIALDIRQYEALAILCWPGVEAGEE